MITVSARKTIWEVLGLADFFGVGLVFGISGLPFFMLGGALEHALEILIGWPR